MEHVEPEEMAKAIQEADEAMQRRYIEANELSIKLFKYPVIFTGKITVGENKLPYITAFCNDKPLINPESIRDGFQFLIEFGNFVTGLKTISLILVANAAVNN